MAGSSSSTNNPSEEYDVFLSFRGEDTRNGFTSHLYAALCRKKIHAFIDDQIVRGNEISSFLLNTIEASKISVIIFSKNYASSRWCLQELEQILHCMKTDKQIVIPVFYHVDPSDVRNQTGSFGDGFAELEKRTKEKLEMLQRWKTSLNEAASLAGCTINDKKSESKLIDETLDEILMRLNKLSPSDYTDLVGIESAIKTIESLLHKGSNGVSIIGIWGIGGVGKTTIARVVFNKILRDFEGSYFAENVREESEKNSRLTHLQEKLLSTILEDRDPNLGLTFTRKRFEDKKVLIVFDDVTSLQQIENLIGNLNWLSSKSQIIITTRDKQVLRNCGVDDAYIYKVGGLREEEAHILFNRYAFKQDSPPVNYMELSKKALAYTKCLPLALKVLGSYLFSKGKEFWERAITKLEKGPPSDIHKVLRVSYDGLEEEEKNLFLDIACFFKQEHIDSVIEILNACDICAKQGIEVLIDKCLVFVTFNELTMHDLIQEMGRKIARDDTCKDVRLWHHLDILKAFKKNKGIEAVRGINLDISKISNAGLNCHVLSKMDNLRFFRVYNSKYEDNYETKLDGFLELESFPNDITFFGWNNYPFKSLPLSFPSESLVRLDMRYSKVEHWNGVQNLVNLKYIDLSYSKHMTEIPNLSSASNLQELNLKGCSSLLEITPSSIQNLNNLVELNLSYCERLISLPNYIQSKRIYLDGCSNLKRAPEISCKVEYLGLGETAIKESPFIEQPSRLVELDLGECSSLESLSSSICKLKSLQMLNLTDCSKLERLPNDFGDLEALEFLEIEGTVIKEVPSSILRLQKISRLCLDRHVDKPPPLNWVLNSSSGSSSLLSLSLENCQITKLPDNLGQLSSLKKLNLSGNNFESIPESIKGFSNLYDLDISNCRRLQFLPELPMGVNVLASDCSSLQSISDPSFLLLPHWRSRTSIFKNCFELDLHKILHEESCREFCANICFPGNEIPKWFTFQNTGSYITLDQSLDWHNKNFLGFLTSAVVCQEDADIFSYYHAICYCLVKSEDGKEQIYRNDITSRDFHFNDDYCDIEDLDGIYSDHIIFRFHSIMKTEFREYDEKCHREYLEECDGEYYDISSEMKSLNCKVLIKFHAHRGEVKKCGIHFLYVEDYGEPLETSRRSLDHAKKKGKEKEKDELQSNKLQISNSFDSICSLRPRFMSNCPLDLECLEAQYWKLKRNALREIVKNALLNVQQNTILCSKVEEMNCVNPKGCMGFPGTEILEWFSFQSASSYIELPLGLFKSKFAGLAFCTVVEFPNLLDLGQPFFVNCELRFKKYDGSYKAVAIGSIQGWFEGDRTHYIKSDHVFLGYDCVMYTRKAFDSIRWHSSDKAIINFNVTNYNGVVIECCKVKKCGVRLLYAQDFENKWKNPIDLSSLKRRLKLNENGLFAARDWQFRSSAASLNLNLMVGSTMIDTTEPHSKRLKICNNKNKYEDGKEEVEELSPSTSQPTGFAIFDLNEFPIDDEDEPQPKRLKEF